MEKLIRNAGYPAELMEAAEAKARRIQEMRCAVCNGVLGHEVQEQPWEIFDDMLTLEYDHLVKLLHVLDERAG